MNERRADPNILPEQPCPNCGTRSPFRLAPWSTAQLKTIICVACGSWSCPGPFTQSASTLYDEGYFNGNEYLSYSGSSAARNLNFERKWKIIRQHVNIEPENIRVLEMGSATGDFLKFLRSKGVRRSVGIEVSPYCLAAAAQSHLPVYSPEDPQLFEILKDLRPNLIVGWDVWEHLGSPAETFSDLFPFCAADTIFTVTTVDAQSRLARTRKNRWRLFHPPTHLNYPTRKGLHDFLIRHQFANIKQFPFGYHRPLNEYLTALQALVGIKRLGRLPNNAITNLPVYLNVWDNQMVIARRTLGTG